MRIPKNRKKKIYMKKFIIERKIAGAGAMTDEDLRDVSKTSNAVISVLGKPYTWLESFVTPDTVYCIHEAENEDDIREHSNCASLPINSIKEIKATIGPSTALT